MEAIASASSVIAVIDLSAKVASLLFQYLTAVKKARPDIERLQGELDRLNTTLEGTRHLLESPNGTRLQTSQRLQAELSGCSSQLTDLETRLEKKLNTRRTTRMMSRYGIRRLKWPFESKDLDTMIKAFERHRDALTAALTIDQT